MLGASDERQLEHATSRELVILSHNRRHFRRLHAVYQQQGDPHGGIVLLPAAPLPWLQVRAAMMLDWAATFQSYRSRIFQWNDLQMELATGYRPTGYSEDDIRLSLGQEV